MPGIGKEETPTSLSMAAANFKLPFMCPHFFASAKILLFRERGNAAFPCGAKLAAFQKNRLRHRPLTKTYLVRLSNRPGSVAEIR
mgnify:CR=1 FL=1